MRWMMKIPRPQWERLLLAVFITGFVLSALVVKLVEGQPLIP